MENLHSDLIFNIISRLPLSILLSVGSYNISISKLKLYYIDYSDDDGDEINTSNIGDEKYTNTRKKKLKEIDNLSLLRDYRGFNTMVGSCNGLVCFNVRGSHISICDPVYICNPMTGEYVNLPKLIPKPEAMMSVSGFGYHNSTDEYKVLRIIYTSSSRSTGNLSDWVGHVEVYTLGNGIGWRNKGEIPYLFRVKIPGILANGALHWVDTRTSKIAAFDLADEEFRLLPSPPCGLDCRLQYLGGYLCCVDAISITSLNIWAFKKNKNSGNWNGKGHDNHSCWIWSKEFSIPISGHCSKNYVPVVITKSKEVILFKNGSLYCYNSKTAILKELRFDEFNGDGPSQAIPHVNNFFVSLKDTGEKSNFPKEKKKIESKHHLKE